MRSRLRAIGELRRKGKAKAEKRRHADSYTYISPLIHPVHPPSTNCEYMRGPQRHAVYIGTRPTAEAPFSLNPSPFKCVLRIFFVSLSHSRFLSLSPTHTQTYIIYPLGSRFFHNERCVYYALGDAVSMVHNYFTRLRLFLLQC